MADFESSNITWEDREAEIEELQRIRSNPNPESKRYRVAPPPPPNLNEILPTRQQAVVDRLKASNEPLHALARELIIQEQGEE